MHWLQSSMFGFYSFKVSAQCLMNPSAGYEIDMEEKAVEAGKREKIAVVGAGPAGLAFSTTASRRDTMLHF